MATFVKPRTFQENCTLNNKTEIIGRGFVFSNYAHVVVLKGALFNKSPPQKNCKIHLAVWSISSSKAGALTYKERNFMKDLNITEYACAFINAVCYFAWKRDCMHCRLTNKPTPFLDNTTSIRAKMEKKNYRKLVI